MSPRSTLAGRPRGAWCGVALALAGCSLDGIADGAGTGTGTGAGDATTADVASSISAGGATTANGSSVTASSGTGGAGGDGGSASAGDGGAGGGGSPPTSALFAWADSRAGTLDDSTLGTDARIAAIAVDAELVVLARVVADEAVGGVSQDRVLIEGLDPARGEVLFTVEARRGAGDADDRTQLGLLAVSGRTVAVPLGFRGQLDLGGGAVLTASGEDAAVLLIDVDDPGATPRALVLGGAGVQTAQSLAFTGNGDLLVGGRFSDTLTCPGGGTGLAGNRGFVARFEPITGTCRRAVHFGPIGPASPDSGVRGLAVDGPTALAVGAFEGTMTIDGKTLVAAGPDEATDAFLVRIALGGDTVAFRTDSERRYGGPANDVLRAAVALAGGGFAVAGSADDSDVAFCPGAPVPAGAHAAVLRIEQDGTCTWLRTWKTDGSSRMWSARSLARAGDGGLVVSGVLRTMTPCTGEAPWSGSDADGFVLRLDPATGVPTHGVHLAGGAEQTATALAAPGAATLPIVAGSYDGNPFDPLLPVTVSRDLFAGGLLPLPALTCTP